MASKQVAIVVFLATIKDLDFYIPIDTWRISQIQTLATS